MKDFILKLIESARGDDLIRAKKAFEHLSKEQMDTEYFNSGKTPAQILEGYEMYDKKINDAIFWLKTK